MQLSEGKRREKVAAHPEDAGRKTRPPPNSLNGDSLEEEVEV